MRSIVKSSSHSRHRKSLEIDRRLSREGVLYLVILIVLLLSAMTSGVNLLVLIFGMLLGALIANWVLIRPILRGATARRHLPNSVFAGESFAVEIDLENQNRFLSNWSISVQDCIRSGKKPSRPTVWFPRVAVGDCRSGVYRGVLPHRGRYEWGSLKLSTSFPLGLAHAVMELPAKDSLCVYPRLGKLLARWIQGWEELDASRARGALSRSAMEEEFRSLREFRPGDSTRWIHWRTTARQGELMVREFEHPQTQDSLVLLDLWAPDSPGQTEREVVEDAVSFAATVCTAACRSGRGRIVLGIAGREKQVVQGQASPGLIHRLLTALACAEPAPWTDAAAVLEELSRYGTGEGRFVLVGTRTADWFREGQSSAARRLAQRTRERIILLDASSAEFSNYFQRWPVDSVGTRSAD